MIDAPKFTAGPQSPFTLSDIYKSLPPNPPGRSEAKYKYLPSAVIEQLPSHDSELILEFNFSGLLHSVPTNLLAHKSPGFLTSLAKENNTCPSGDRATAASLEFEFNDEMETGVFQVESLLLVLLKISS